MRVGASGTAMTRKSGRPLPDVVFFLFGSPGLQLYIAAEQLRASVRPEQVVKLLRASRCAL